MGDQLEAVDKLGSCPGLLVDFVLICLLKRKVEIFTVGMELYIGEA